MTMAEYFLRVAGFKRELKRQMFRDRRTWFNTLVGPHMDPKALPRSEQAYMPLDGEEPGGISPQMRERWKKAVADYNKKKDG